ncbi:MAG: AMP-binding protein [Vicinamibacterales bacterium]
MGERFRRLERGRAAEGVVAILNLYADLLEARLRDGRGGQPAILTDDDRCSYRALDARAAAWAACLHASGVRAGERVLIALPDGVDLVAALFGALRIGAIAALANPRLPAGQLAGLVSYIDAAVAVTAPDRAAECAHAGDRLRPTLAPADVRPGGEVPPAHRGSPGDDAVWQFTSGSSGEPKAVRHSHWSFASAAEAWGREVLGLTEHDVTIAVPRLFFGYAMGANLIFPFSVGASVVLFDERPTAAAVATRVVRHRATVLVTTPASVRQMTTAVEVLPAHLASLRVATSAGEALPASVALAWSRRFRVPLIDGLGMTEMGHIVIGQRIGDAVPGSVGRPVPGYEVRLCDQHGADVAGGEPGELWVRGPSRALGYWQRPEAEARVFRGEWCVPGDMLRQLPDGRFEFCGRTDDLFKVNGQWVAPAAVEECLLTHPAVRECAVVGEPDDDGLIRPHAFVVADQITGSLTSELQAFVRERLAPHAHPRRVSYVDALPRTSTGKLDRAGLRALD